MNYKIEPKTTADMVFSSASVKEKLCDIIFQTQPFPCSSRNSLLLYGTFGSGKTTYAKVFLNDFEQYFGGDEASIDLINCDNTEKISSIVKRCNSIADYRSFNASHLHYFIFDEIDNLKTDAQRALKSFMNRKNVVCVLTTNYLDKIDEGVKSRCELIDFNAAEPADYIWRMKRILVENQLPMLSDNVMMRIVKSANGDWRSINSLLLRASNKVNANTRHVPVKSLLKIV